MSTRERVECSGVNSYGHDAISGAHGCSGAGRFIGMRIMPQGSAREANSASDGAQQGKMHLPGLVGTDHLPAAKPCLRADTLCTTG